MRPSRRGGRIRTAQLRGCTCMARICLGERRCCSLGKMRHGRRMELCGETRAANDGRVSAAASHDSGKTIES